MGKSSKTRRPYGSGSIRNLGGDLWEVSVCNGRRADGERRRKSRRVHGDWNDAEAELVRLRAEMGASPNAGDVMTLDAYFWGVYVPDREQSLRQSPDEAILARGTLNGYISFYRKHIAPAFGAWEADEIDTAAVRHWAMRLPSAAAAEKGVRYLRAIMRAMWDDELLDDKPLERRVKLPRHQVEPVGVWSPEELLEALQRLRGHQLEALVLAIAGGGLRREEALALDLPDDLEFAEETAMDGTTRTVCRLTVRKAWVDGDAQRKRTKTYQVRPVTIDDPFAARLAEVVADGRTKLLMRRDGSAPLVPTSVPETWRRAFGPRGPLHGMRFVELRTMRHLHETLTAVGGIGDARNAMLHGHSQAVMYSNYLALASDDADRMAEAVRAALT